MASITLRPDLRTSGGEITELLLDGRFVGTMTLVYREGDRLSGSVQLDRESLPGERKETAIAAARQYVQQLMNALEASDCEVIVTCSSYDHIIASEHQVGVIESFEDEEESFDPDYAMDADEESQLDDVDPDDVDTIEMIDGRFGPETGEPFYCELVIVGESRNRVEYHIYDEEQNWLAEAFVRIRGTDVIGEIDWKVMPSEEEIEHVTDLLVSDFDPDEIDSFELDMKMDGDTIETIELTHEDLLGEDEYAIGHEPSAAEAENDYSIVLVRDDGDTLTYDLYERSHGALPIGQATVDISSRRLAGFIDFRHPDSSDDSDVIGVLLMQELDKEKDYESLNLTMLVNNEPVDEILFETETVH